MINLQGIVHGGMRETLRCDEGQMVVEMAAVAPVVIAVAVIVTNLMMFMVGASRFDRVALDAVLAVAVAPTGEAGDRGQEQAVREAIERAMNGMRGMAITVEVIPGWRDASTGGIGFSCAPHLTKYRCTLLFEPWPQGFSVAGVAVGTPPVLRHERSIVVDRYRTGVVV